MQTQIENRIQLVVILATVLIVFGSGVSYAQTVTASTPQPLTGATLNNSIVTLTLQGGAYERLRWDIAEGLTVSGIPGVAIGNFNQFGQIGPTWFGVERVSDTMITVKLGGFNGDIDTDTTLTFTVGAAAIANYNGAALTAKVTVYAQAADETPVENPTAQVPDGRNKVVGAPDPPQENQQTEVPVATLPGRATALPLIPLTGGRLNKVVLTLNDKVYERAPWDIADALTVSGIPGVTIGTTGPAWFGIDRISNSKIAVELGLPDNINPNNTLTFTIGSGAIMNYNGLALTAELPAASLRSQQAGVPWLWMVVPTDPRAGGGISADIDSLADASGGFITETHVAQNGVSEGDSLGQQRWISSAIHWSEHQCRKYDVERQQTIIPSGALTDGILPDVSLDVCINPTVCWANNINNVIRPLGMGTGQNTKAHTAYALINLISPYEQTDAVMTMTSGDASKVWLNGNVVHREAAESLGCRKIDVPLACDPWVCITDPALQESRARHISVTLNAGNNLLLVKVRQHGEYWDMRLELEGKVSISDNTSFRRPKAPDAIFIAADVNGDGSVDFQDLILVIKALGGTAPTNPRVDVNGDGRVDKADLLLIVENLDDVAIPAAPANRSMLAALEPATLQAWINLLQGEDDGSMTLQYTIRLLQNLLAASRPNETLLLANYPNPFNPETWIPYQLSKSAEVTLTIYASNGQIIRWLPLGHQNAGMYQTRSRAAYWDGKNDFGEQAASGVYFYRLRAGDYSATRKMLIRK